MGFKLTRFTDLSRSVQFELAAKTIGYSELGEEVLNDFVSLGLGSSEAETTAYRLADVEPPILGKDLTEYQRGISRAMNLLVEREEARNV